MDHRLRGIYGVFKFVCFRLKIPFLRHDTKIMLNSVKARVKKGKVDKIMNMQIMLIFFVQVLIKAKLSY